jgi:hypothetical protein
VASLDRDDPVLPFVLMGTDTARYRAHLPVADWLAVWRFRTDSDRARAIRVTTAFCAVYFHFHEANVPLRKLPPSLPLSLSLSLSLLFGKASWLAS